MKTLIFLLFGIGDFLTDHEIEESGMSDVALYREDWFYADFICGGRIEGSDAMKAAGECYPDPQELHGKNLACWCKLPEPGEPDICHAAVLLEIANA